MRIRIGLLTTTGLLAVPAMACAQAGDPPATPDLSELNSFSLADTILTEPVAADEPADAPTEFSCEAARAAAEANQPVGPELGENGQVIIRRVSACEEAEQAQYRTLASARPVDQRITVAEEEPELPPNCERTPDGIRCSASVGSSPEQERRAAELLNGLLNHD